jgi:uncharacterized cupin superfamily protein
VEHLFVADISAVVSFRATVAPQCSVPDAARRVSGEPRLTVWNYYSDPTQQFFAGVWSATRGCWRINYAESEFCHLLQGRVALTDQAGERAEFGPGDSFVIPAGFVGTWEVIEDCRKVYAIFEASALASV